MRALDARTVRRELPEPSPKLSLALVAPRPLGRRPRPKTKHACIVHSGQRMMRAVTNAPHLPESRRPTAKRVAPTYHTELLFADDVCTGWNRDSGPQTDVRVLTQGRVKTQSMLMVSLAESRGMMKGFVLRGGDRQQDDAVPECLEHWVEEKQSCSTRGMCFVDALELATYGSMASSRQRRPAPRIILRECSRLPLRLSQPRPSSRRLEREAARNLEVCAEGRLVPDHKKPSPISQRNGPRTRSCASVRRVVAARGAWLAKAQRCRRRESKFKPERRNNKLHAGQNQRRPAAVDGACALHEPTRHRRPRSAAGETRRKRC